MSLTLRQICLVVRDLEGSTRLLHELFGIESAYTDPAVAKYGLLNRVFPVGTNFLELVSPTREGTAGGRHLERRGGDAGYMVIVHCDSIPAWRAHVEQQGMRIVNAPTYEHYAGIHLHPADTGGAILEFNRDQGGDDPMGSYHPAGPHWQSHMRTHIVEALTAAELQSPDPEKLARRWGGLLKAEPRKEGDAWLIALDSGLIRVVPATDGRGEGLCGIDLRARDPQAVLDRAAAVGLPVSGRTVSVCGMRMRL